MVNLVSLVSLVKFGFWYWLFGVGHEMSHVLCAVFLHHWPSFSVQNLVALMLCRRVHIPMTSETSKSSKTSPKCCEAAVRNAGWMGSVLLMLVSSSVGLSLPAQAAAAFTLFEAGDPAGNAAVSMGQFAHPFDFLKARPSSQLW